MTTPWLRRDTRPADTRRLPIASNVLAFQFVVPWRINETHDYVLREVSPALANLWKYKVTGDTGASITFTRRYTPTWAVVLAILGLLFFLLGLLFLLVKTEDVLVLSFTSEGEQTRMMVSGSGPPKVLELFSGVGHPAGSQAPGLGGYIAKKEERRARNTPAAWYPDPQRAGQLRWWDGAGWTDHYAPASTDPPPAPATADE